MSKIKKYDVTGTGYEDDFSLNIYEDVTGEWVKAYEVEDLLAVLEEYLYMDSTDGRRGRRALRDKLKEYVNE